MPDDPELLGRQPEKVAIERLLSEVRSRQSKVLVMRGAPGIGKTALLKFVAAASHDLRVIQFSASEAEANFAFAGLHQLCSQLPIGPEDLPRPQRQALGVALGIVDGDQPNLFLVGLATLSLISAVAQDEPCVVLIDDVQWLDQMSRRVFAFVARRLEIDAVALFFTSREESDEFAGLPEMRLVGLSADDSARLLERVVTGPLTPTTRDSLLELCEGNPLAILELCGQLSPLELLGAVTFGGFSGGLSQVERSFERRIAKLPPETRTLLLLAAAEPQGQWDTVNRAAQLLEIRPGALDAAELEGLARLGTEDIAFRHPLVRSAVYRAASPSQRRKAHQILAAVCDPDLERAGRAWHRAQAAIGPNEEIAADLETSAAQATERGGLGAAAALLGRAVALTPDSRQKSVRALRASRAAMDVGDRRQARELLDLVDDKLLSTFEIARKHQLDATLIYSLNPGASAVKSLVQAAGELLPYEIELARSTYLEALLAAVYHTSSSGMHGWVDIAKSLRALLDRSKPLQAVDLMLDGLTTMMIDGHELSAPILRDALASYLSDDVSPEDVLRWWQLGWYSAVELWDYDSTVKLIERTVRLARIRGSLAVLPVALIHEAMIRTLLGELDLADAVLQEGQDLFKSIGQSVVPFPAPVTAAIRGSEYSGVADGLYGVMAQYFSTLLLANGHSRYQDGAEAARQAIDHDILSVVRIFPEVIETATRCGELGLAETALQRVRTQTLPSGSDYGLGMLRRCEALLDRGPRADALYQESILRLERTRSRYQWARGHLVYGEWLLEENRKDEAKAHLLIAHEALTTIGARAFAVRAERGLRAAGGEPRIHLKNLHATLDDPRTRLTPREDQIARLAASGETNVQIAAELFLSPATVDYHLRKVFQKLNINSRRSLAYALNQAKL